MLSLVGDHESAISTYRHVLRTTPDWIEAHYGLARALLAVGGKLQALAHLERFCSAVGAIAPELREPEIDERRANALRFVDDLRTQLGVGSGVHTQIGQPSHPRR